MKRKYGLLMIIMVLLIMAGCINNKSDPQLQIVQGKVETKGLTSTNIALKNQNLLINGIPTTTDGTGSFQVTMSDENFNLQSQEINQVTIEVTGFNIYKTYNWVNGNSVYLRPYLSIVKNAGVYFQHCFSYLLDSNYEVNENDYVKFSHESGLEYELKYEEKVWGEKLYNNVNWASLNEIKQGKWELEAYIEGEEIRKSFVVNIDSDLIDDEPRILEHKLNESSISIKYEIPGDLDRVYIRCEDYPYSSCVLFEIPNLTNNSIEIPLDELGINKVASNSYRLFIQTVKKNGLQCGYQILSEQMTEITF